MQELKFNVQTKFEDGDFVLMYSINDIPVTPETYHKVLEEYYERLNSETEYEECDCEDCTGECLDDCECESWDDDLYEGSYDEDSEDLCPTCKSYLDFADEIMMCENDKEVLDLVSDFADFHFQNGRMSAFGQISDTTAELHNEIMDVQLERSEEFE